MFKKSQFGRSMIEMLGVLAIIGVLSVGGLAGYAKAMRAYKVNEAIDYMNRARVEFRAQKAAGNVQSAEYYRCDDLLDEDLPPAIDRCQVQSHQYGATYDNLLLAHFASDELQAEAVSKLNASDRPDIEKLDRKSMAMYTLKDARPYVIAFWKAAFYK